MTAGLAAAFPVRQLRVVSWNIRAGIGPGEPFPPAWWRHVRRDRLERIGAILAALDADVVALQEVAVLNVDGEIHDQPGDLARVTGRHARYGAVHAFPLIEPDTGRAIGSASWGNALLTRLPIEDGFTRGLPRATDDEVLEPPGTDHPLAGVRYGDADPGHREARCAVGGRLAAGGGASIAIVTAHLTYIGRGQRRAQATALARLADGLGPQVVVAGDFNAPIDSDDLGALGGGFDDAFAAAGVAPGDPRRRTSGSASIDHVLSRGMTIDACRVAPEAGNASDHWPVVVDLTPAPTG